MGTSPRPAAKRQSSRVPGGFDTDEDIDDVEDSQTIEAHPNDQKTPHAHFSQSMASQSTEEGGVMLGAEASTMEEREIRKRLMEMDSSFIQQPSPVVPVRTDEADDARTPSPSRANDLDAEHSSSLQSPHTPADMYKTPAPRTEQRYSDSKSTSSTKHSISSPIAERVARSHSNARSATSLEDGYKTADDTTNEMPSQKGEVDNGRNKDRTPRRRNTQTSIASSTRDPLSPSKTDGTQAVQGDPRDEANDITLSPGSARKLRPRLSHRMTSQRLSYSSTRTMSSNAGSEMTLGADYALQSGGAVPFDSFTGTRPRLESRKFSLTSIASGMSGYEEGEDKVKDGPLREMGTLEEEGNNFKDPATPTVEYRNEEIPSDTVVARRVQEVQVPGTVVREFHARNRSVSPEKRNGARSNRNNTTLTLKEQGSTIDKLIKENFDLKLKIGFLNDALKKRSDESVSATISENVELKASKVTSAKEIRSLKKSIRDLERKLKVRDDELTESLRDQNTRGGRSIHEAEESEELKYLRERVSSYETELESIRQHAYQQETEKRKLVDLLKSSRGSATHSTADRELEVWKDLLETETAKKEQAEEEINLVHRDNNALQEEVEQLRRELSSMADLHGIDKDETVSVGPEGSLQPLSGTNGTAKTLVEEVADLRSANVKLKREVRAQTSMLTSRNKEREFLNGEIEELKMKVRGTSIAGDSMFERSVSRAQGRPPSGVSDGTHMTPISESERDMLEAKIDELREQASGQKLKNQEQEAVIRKQLSELDSLMDEIEHHDAVIRDYEQRCEDYSTDLQELQAERDEAVRSQHDYEAEIDYLRSEAQQQIDVLEEEADAKSREIQRLTDDLSSGAEEREALQREIRSTSEGLMRIEDDVQIKNKRIQDLEQEVEELTQEIETIRDEFANHRTKYDRCNVQLESAQKENSFLREEQESDKMKIGDLESDLTSERSLTQELQQRLAQEKHQREVVDSKEKEGVQKLLDELTKEASEVRAEARDLKHDLQDKELEVTTFRERLVELESNLREILGEPDGTRSSMLTSIARMQQDLESTLTDLENTRQELSNKEHLLRHRDSLLESNGLEFRKLSDLLDRERAAHRSTKTQHEQWQRTHAHTTRTVTQKDVRISELESGRNADRKKLATLEAHYKDQLSERNGLLLTLWNKVAPLCGSDWQHQNSLVDRNHLPTMEVVATMLNPFSRNLLLAVHQIESLLSESKGRIHQVEQTLQKEYSSLENQLEDRVRKLDSLEAALQSQRVKSEISAAPEIAKLRGENRLLKSELGNIHKQEVFARAASRTPSGSPSRGLSNGSLAAPAPTFARTHSSAATLETAPRTSSLSAASSGQRSPSNSPTHTRKQSAASLIPLHIPPPGTSSGNREGGYNELSVSKEPKEQRWLHRLKELERRLKAEREARLLDRTAARKRVEEAERGNERLRGELERERHRRELAQV